MHIVHGNELLEISILVHIGWPSSWPELQIDWSISSCVTVYVYKHHCSAWRKILYSLIVQILYHPIYNRTGDLAFFECIARNADRQLVFGINHLLEIFQEITVAFKVRFVVGFGGLRRLPGKIWFIHDDFFMIRLISEHAIFFWGSLQFYGAIHKRCTQNTFYLCATIHLLRIFFSLILIHWILCNLSVCFFFFYNRQSFNVFISTYISINSVWTVHNIRNVTCVYNWIYWMHLSN